MIVIDRSNVLAVQGGIFICFYKNFHAKIFKIWAVAVWHQPNT
jgi:hypothetical protein